MNNTIFLITISILIKAAPILQAQGWSNAGLSYPSTVYTIADYNGALQVGGAFSAPNEMRAVCIYNGDLYSGGTNGGASTNVYKNGVSIGALGGGSNFVFAMAVYNNQLYVAGSFASINGVAANNIARWNGSVWTNVGSGTGVAGDYVNALCAYNGALYAGGGQSGNCFKWNGSTWSVAGNFSENSNWGYIRSMGVYANELYIGGTFDTVDGVGAVNLAKYNGTFWSSAGDIGIAGNGNGVSAIAEYNGEIYCGGFFSVAGGNAASNIAHGNGSNWQPLGTGTGTVFALHVFNQVLYVGGNFSSAGGISVGNIAKWIVCTPPAATITYSGAPYLCPPGGSVLLNANAGVGFTYQWKKNGSIISGATSSSYNATVIGTYTVVVTNSSACSATSSGVLIGSKTIFASITPPGPVSFCNGGNALLTAYIGTNYIYQWKKNGVVIPGATSSTYNATSAGSYTVDETGGPCTKTSNAVTVTVNPLPSAKITAAGPLTFCPGGSVVLNAPVTANLSYQWKKNGVDISGAVSSSFTAAVSGNYKVKVTNATTGCAKTTSTATVVTVDAASATITPQGPTTFCAGGSVTLQANTGAGLSYKWKKNGTYITVATLPGYAATLAATYKVEVTNNTGCSKTSPGVTVSVPCREGEVLNAENNFNIYPIPATSKINIDLSSEDDFAIEIINAFGEILVKERNQNTIDISNLARGIYYIKILQGNNFYSQKFIRQ